MLSEAAVTGAIDEMVFVGGALNLTLLGGPGAGGLTSDRGSVIY